MIKLHFDSYDECKHNGYLVTRTYDSYYRVPYYEAFSITQGIYINRTRNLSRLLKAIDYYSVEYEENE